MKLKLDLHTIYNDSQKIESSLQAIITEAVQKRITEVEIIPGKGSGALKKTVLRFLERPDIKAQYHRIEKDGENWGRLFVHFRWERLQDTKKAPTAKETATYVCFCCDATNVLTLQALEIQESESQTRLQTCPACGSPNELTITTDREGVVAITSIPGYG